MGRRIRPTVESLEGRALLSGMASSLAVRLTAVPQTSTTGTQVVFTLTETNVSNHEVSLAVGPTNDGFVVSQNGNSVWVSNTGIQPQFLMNQTLTPGQSYTLNETWDARSNLFNPSDPSQKVAALSGKFTVRNELDQSGQITPFTIAQTSTAKLTHIVPPKPPLHLFH